MPKSSTPWKASWKEVGEDLRGLQERISLYKGRFEAAGRKDISDELEQCIVILIGAQGVAQTLDLKDRGLG